MYENGLFSCSSYWSLEGRQVKAVEESALPSMTAVKAMFLGKVYGWHREVHNLKHDIMEHMESYETSEGNAIPLNFWQRK